MSEIISGANLANASKEKTRRKLDFYPTPSEVTVALMEFLWLPKMTIWECACGDGAMSKVLEKYGHNVISTDLEESSGFGEGGVDFLTTKKTCDAIITNPPFSVSAEFITHAISQSGIVAMVLKSQYWHAKKRTELFNEFPPSYVLPLNWRPDFMGGERGGSPTMEVHWTVWVSGQTDTRYKILAKHKAMELT